MGETTTYFSCTIACAICGDKWTEALELTALEKFRSHDCPNKEHVSMLDAQWWTEEWLEGSDHG